MKTGIDYISAERERQINEEGYTIVDDFRTHDQHELERAACAYAMPEGYLRGPYYMGIPKIFPWGTRYWKPTPDDRIRELAKAGALIAAAIDVELEKKRRNDKA